MSRQPGGGGTPLDYVFLKNAMEQFSRSVFDLILQLGFFFPAGRLVVQYVLENRVRMSKFGSCSFASSVE